jgi:Ca-activated chloride channel family protein
MTESTTRKIRCALVGVLLLLSLNLFAARQQERSPIALVVVFDHSGSMAGAKMDLAKQATKAPLDSLNEKDRFGVLVFDYNFKWLLDIAEVRNKDTIRTAIDSIVATGNTNIYPALRDAYEKIRNVPAPTKHIILLSDGQTPKENFEVLVSEMKKNNVTVSTVALTAASDVQLMADIATWGDGRTYYVEMPQNLARAFQIETEALLKKAARN